MTPPLRTVEERKRSLRTPEERQGAAKRMKNDTEVVEQSSVVNIEETLEAEAMVTDDILIPIIEQAEGYEETSILLDYALQQQNMDQNTKKSVDLNPKKNVRPVSNFTFWKPPVRPANIASKMGANSTPKNENVALKDKINILEDSNKALTRENNDMKTMIQTLQKNLEDVQKAKECLIVKIAEKEERNVILSDENNQLKTTIRNLNLHLDQVRKEKEYLMTVQDTQGTHDTPDAQNSKDTQDTAEDSEGAVVAKDKFFDCLTIEEKEFDEWDKSLKNPSLFSKMKHFYVSINLAEEKHFIKTCIVKTFEKNFIQKIHFDAGNSFNSSYILKCLIESVQEKFNDKKYDDTVARSLIVKAFGRFRNAKCKRNNNQQ